MFTLAGALVYFSITLKGISDQIPVIVSEIQASQERIDPVIEEIQEVRLLIREEVPPIVSEVAAVRVEIPVILKEVALYRENIPGILEEVALYREQIPAIVDQMEAIQSQLPSVLAETKSVRETIPGILDEVEAVRLAIPGYLEDADSLVGEIETAGRKASAGAVQGVFTGILKTPAALVSNFGENILDSPEIGEEARALIKETALVLLENGVAGDSKNWQDPRSDARGSISIHSIDDSESEHCVELRVKVFRKRKMVFDKVLIACESDKGVWNLAENTSRNLNL